MTAFVALKTAAADPYTDAIRDVGKLLVEAASWANGDDDIGANFKSLKVHLSCWSGKAEHMTALLKAFPQNLYFGFDGTVTFSKAVHVHECAFDVPLSRILLETGSPSTIPAVVAKSLGRNAFCHSGHIPYIAESIAKYSSRNAARSDTNGKTVGSELSSAMATATSATMTKDITAEVVARCATANIVTLYGQQLRNKMFFHE